LLEVQRAQMVEKDVTANAIEETLDVVKHG
jgi:hypothetical protein